MESAVVKHSIVIAGHRTSVSLEQEFWTALKDIAHVKHMTLSDLVALIDSDRRHSNLSSAIRLFVLGFYRDQNSLEPSKHRGGRTPPVPRSASA
jgi:predicted DNA-binding ribbon-helix-helix protein